MGMPTEWLTPTQIRAHYGTVNTLLPSPDPPILDKPRELAAGQVTDDTENTVFICRMLIATGGQIDKKRYVNALLHWLKTDPASATVTGPSTRRAMTAIEAETPIAEAGKFGTTNGAAMKIAPLGLVRSYHELSSLIASVAEICTPTHNTQVAIQGAAVIAAAVSYLFENDQVDWADWYALLLQTATAAAEYGNPLPTPSLAKRLLFGKQLAETTDERGFGQALYETLGTGLETIQLVPAAVSLVYKYKGDLTACVQVAANIGGDTDTLGAVCGAICGGYRFNVPQIAVQQLRQANPAIHFHQLAVDLTSLVPESAH